MKTHIEFPNYAKIILIIIGLFFIVAILYLTKSILIPICYAIIFAIVLTPIINFLVNKKINKIVAIAIVLLISLSLVAGFVTILASQASRLSDAWPQLSAKFQLLLNQLLDWTAVHLNISEPKMKEWMNNGKEEAMGNASTVIGTTLSTVGAAMGALFLMPIYIAMLLYYKPLLVEFIHRLFGSHNDTSVTEILTQIRTIIQSYLVGLFTEFTIVAILNSLGLFILGIDYALLLGISGAVLNIVPYLGGLITMGILAIIALITKPPIYVLYLIIMYGCIQFIDNNYLVPKIVGSKVKLNALISLIIVILGAALWGIHGMFLAIPFAAIIKLICDKVEALKPWGYLLGDHVDYAARRNTKIIKKKNEEII